MSAPTLPTGHEEYEALAVAWAISALEPADSDRFEEHRARCERCKRTVEAALEVVVALAHAVPDEVPPPALRRRVLAAAARTPRPGRQAVPASPAPAPRRSRPGTDWPG